MQLPRDHYSWFVAQGRDFDVDQYASESPHRIDDIWHREDQSTVGDSCCGYSGLRVELGCGTEDSAEEQQEIAAAFLRENEAALTRLRAFPGVEHVYVGVELTVDPRSRGSVMDMLPSLMQIALKIGVEITIWSTVEPECPPS